MNIKRTSVNFITCIVVFGINMGIQFFLTPYLVKEVGDAAYGYIGLANNFVSYISVLTVALNSMSSRFIAIEFHKGNTRKANEYITSTCYGNLLVGAGVLAGAILLVLNINHILNISDELQSDVRITFFLVFLSFTITLCTSCFTVCTFVKNRLDISSIRNMIQNIIKVIIIVAVFALFPAKIYYISFATLVSGICIAIANINLTKKLTPELKIAKKYFKWKSLKDIVSSGVWNSLNSLSSSLFTGLDLVLANLLVNEIDMGLLSISKSIPAIVGSFFGSLSGLFTPTFTTLYANDNKKELVKEVKQATYVYSALLIVPVTGFIVFGYSFYSLWMPYKNSSDLQKMFVCAVLSILPYLVECFTYPLKALYVVTNHLRAPLVVNLVGGTCSVLITCFLSRFTTLGVYAIAGTSSIIQLLINITFTPIYSAKIIGVNKRSFYPPLLKSILTSAVMVGLFYMISQFVVFESWISFFVNIIWIAMVGYVISFFTIFDSGQRKALINKLIRKRE